MRARAIAAVALLAGGFLGCSRRSEPTPVEQRGTRQAAVAEIAPAPVPATGGAEAGAAATKVALPLVGEEGQDRSGYPRRHVDRAALRSLLLHRSFEDLTDVVERLQAEFERDFHYEYWPDDAAQALGTGEAQLQPVLDAWVKAQPQSFAPYLVRGTHWVERAFERRGGKYTSQTPDENFASMENALQLALADLERAIEIRPKLVAAMRQQLRACLPSGGTDQAGAKVLERALAACPACFSIRATYLHGLTPRWGGSYPAMQAFAQRSQDPVNPRLRLLAGYIDLDRAELLERDDRYDAALEAAERACALGPHWEFLVARARVRAHLGRMTDALADLDRAETLRPGHPDVLVQRAYVLGVSKRWEEASRDLRAALQVEPTHWLARSLHPSVVSGLMYDGWLRFQRGDREGALRLYDLAAELAPDNPEVQGRRAWIIEGGKKGQATPIDVPERAPDDFRAMQQLDYRLAAQGRLEPVVTLWNDFLSRHPDNGQAYLERGGALLHLRRVAEARTDAQKACDLGVSEGCLRAKQLGGAK